MTQATPDLITVGTQEIQDRAKSLGLTWGLRLATVVSVFTGQVIATYDGDTVAIPMVSMIGTLGPGERVYAMSVPPSGNFIVGRGAAYESGTVVFNFTSDNSVTADVTFINPFVNPPRVFTNINSGAGPTASWGSRAFNIATNGFRMFVFGPVATWVNVGVDWAAFAE